MATCTIIMDRNGTLCSELATHEAVSKSEARRIVIACCADHAEGYEGSVYWTVSRVTCTECERSIDGYEPTARDAKVTPAEGLCEDCHTACVRTARRERLDDIEDGRGDYLREMQMERPL